MVDAQQEPISLEDIKIKETPKFSLADGTVERSTVNSCIHYTFGKMTCYQILRDWDEYNKGKAPLVEWKLTWRDELGEQAQIPEDAPHDVIQALEERWKLQQVNAAKQPTQECIVSGLEPKSSRKCVFCKQDKKSQLWPYCVSCEKKLQSESKSMKNIAPLRPVQCCACDAWSKKQFNEKFLQGKRYFCIKCSSWDGLDVWSRAETGS